LLDGSREDKGYEAAAAAMETALALRDCVRHY
ncbi:MAG: 6,7-dimethyl-8-ribityllumazine synthase, partial [Nocardioides sp.]|nr:6,7-dimethyl-8-ribityllumazine synthase [Nocardioides sp.]